MIDASSERATVGRYSLDALIGSGGMARVYVGRLEGLAGFSKRVAIKRLHPDVAADPELAATLLDEARLTGHIRHPNVVSTVDVVREEGEFLLVMEYVVGVPLDVLLKRCRLSDKAPPHPVVAAIAVGILDGLHAAHEATDAAGHPLHIVHRDVSPPNVIVEESGLVKLLDFGIATAANRLTTTKEGTIKGKPSYIAPEQLARKEVDRRADVFAVGVMLWEMLANARLREGASFEDVIADAQGGAMLPSLAESSIDPTGVRLGEIAERATHSAREERWATASEMARAIEAASAVAPHSVVSAWAAETAPDVLAARRAVLRAKDEDAAKLAAASAPTVVHAVDDAAVMARPSKPWRGYALATAALVLLGGAGVAWSWLGAHAPVSDAAATVASTSIAPPSTSPHASSLEAPASSAQPATSGAADASALPVVSTSSAATSLRSSRVDGRGAPPAPHAPARVRKSVPDPCRVPFVIDGAGLKIPKRECL